MSHRIILATNDESVLRIASKILTEAGCELTLYDHGFDTLIGFLNNPPDLLIIDERLEQFDGAFVVQKLVDMPRFAPCPFLYILRRASDIRSFPKWLSPEFATTRRCLTLPFNPEEIITLTEELLDAVTKKQTAS